MVSHTFFVIATVWAMGSIRLDYWIKKHHIPQARLLLLFIAIAIGYTVSNFTLDFIQSSRNLLLLF